MDDREWLTQEPQVAAVAVRFTIAIGPDDRRRVRAQTGTGEPMEIGWYAPVGEALAVHDSGDQRLAVCADDSRALMTLVREFAQAVLDSGDSDDD